MFGYVGGAFTGADPRGRAGFFEEANGGTIFLDEIGELPLPVQAKLLNVIQNKTIFRVGSTKPIQVDVRILAATNRDLKAEVAAGHFRADLYYRLSAFSLELPPLRECQEDIFFLIESLMDGIRRKYDMPDKSLSGEVFSKLVAYDWPGNIRELENVLERAVALSDSDIIYPEHIHLEHEPQAATLRQMLYQEEDRILRQTLQQCGGQPRPGHGAAGCNENGVLRQAQGTPHQLTSSDFGNYSPEIRTAKCGLFCAAAAISAINHPFVIASARKIRLLFVRSAKVFLEFRLGISFAL